ncbi:hypothetical protein [uncultured Neglectibacter sp.]|uniref:hypothetical protein n=1 Tax=uncultured Neglectibacter sp. TaxID=1924108 RepID=UPI0034DFB2E8
MPDFTAENLAGEQRDRDVQKNRPGSCRFVRAGAFLILRKAAPGVCFSAPHFRGFFVAAAPAVPAKIFSEKWFSVLDKGKKLC